MTKSLIIFLRLIPFYVKYSYIKFLNFFLPTKIDKDFWNDLKRKYKSDEFLIVYKKLFKNHNIFIKPSDIISLPYLATGFHERHISLILKHAAKNGYSNFLMDIGANIGFITIQTENSFYNIFCFEPNPISYELLKK
jgi:hypothetical protein